MPTFAKATVGKTLPWLFFLFGLIVATQLGKHWWPEFAFINGMRVDYYAPTLSISNLVLVLIAALTLPRYYITLWIMLLVASLGLVSFSYLSLYRVGQYMAFALALCIMGYATHEERKKFLAGLALMSFMQLILALWQLMIQGSVQGVWWFMGERRFFASTPSIAKISLFGQSFVRPYATFSHPNSMGGFYMLTTLLLWRGKKIAWSIPGIILVLLSFSRIAILGLAVGFLITFQQQKIYCKLCHYARILFSVWLAAFALLPVGSASSWNDRLAMWDNGISRFTSGWWHIPALGDYLYTGVVRSPTLFLQPIHNSLIILLMEWRLLGVALLLLLVVLLYKKMPVAIALPLLLVAFFDHYTVTLMQNILLTGVVIGWYKWSQTNGKKNYEV